MLRAALLAALCTLPAAPPAMVTPVPSEVREGLDLSPFYKKYTDAGGLAVVGSDKVSDAALLEAADTVRHMLADRDDILQAIVKNHIRLAVMSPDEKTTDIPEHSDLTPKEYWDKRARGLGATHERPAVSCAEDNLLNLKGDRYNTENILVHEFAHTVHLMGMNTLDPTFDHRLHDVYDKAMEKGIWRETYAASNDREYFAEGVQAYFDCAAPPAPGVHNDINTRERLEKADPDLFALIDGVFKQSKWRYVRYDKRREAPGQK